jgi:hypothetical protein
VPGTGRISLIDLRAGGQSVIGAKQLLAALKISSADLGMPASINTSHFYHPVYRKNIYIHNLGIQIVNIIR